jgi:DNA-binding response OmpR family regulator
VQDRKRILVVDDEPSICSILSDELTAQGFSVETAANGVEMRSRMAGRSFDLVILDAVLPGERGLDLACHVMRTGARVLMMSGDTFNIDGIVGLKRSVIAKPFRLVDFMREVHAVLPYGGDTVASSGAGGAALHDR